MGGDLKMCWLKNTFIFQMYKTMIQQIIKEGLILV